MHSLSDLQNISGGRQQVQEVESPVAGSTSGGVSLGATVAKTVTVLQIALLQLLLIEPWIGDNVMLVLAPT